MSLYRVTAFFLLVFSAISCNSSFAALAPVSGNGFDLPSCRQGDVAAAAGSAAPLKPLATCLLDASASAAQAQMDTSLAALVTADDAQARGPAAAGSRSNTGRSAGAGHGTYLRQALADFSLTLRDVRYRRGGSEPSTGFDCSGFVRYVFSHAAGSELPHDSAGQFQVGAKVGRSDLKAGDLVFFHTYGKRISHVGIYLGDGQFIHSPSSGKHVRVSRLDEKYWARHFAGAKRPSVLS